MSSNLFTFDVRKAAQTTYDAVQSNYYDILRSNEESLTKEHLLWMLNQIMSGEVEGEKAHRWLGWVWGVSCAAGVGDLEDFKDISSGSYT